MDVVLTERQKNLLKAIINEFMDTAEAVGSTHLPTKYSLGVSPATVRNEMVTLGDLGLIRKAHSSSGRIPTSYGFRYFVEEILDEMNRLAVEEEAKIRESLFRQRFSIDQLLYNAVRKLSNITNTASAAVFSDRVYFAGVAEMIDFPEYQQPHRLKQLLEVLEDPEVLSKLFGRYSNRDDIVILIGQDEIGLDQFEKTAILFREIRLHGGKRGYIAVVGPNRMNYSVVIPSLNWMADTINKSTAGW